MQRIKEINVVKEVAKISAHPPAWEPIVKNLTPSTLTMKMRIERGMNLTQTSVKEKNRCVIVLILIFKRS